MSVQWTSVVTHHRWGGPPSDRLAPGADQVAADVSVGRQERRELIREWPGGLFGHVVSAVDRGPAQVGRPGFPDGEDVAVQGV